MPSSASTNAPDARAVKALAVPSAHAQTPAHTQANTPATVEAAMLQLVERRTEHSSACPSEVAKVLSKTDWRALMPLIQAAAWRLQQQGLLDISQRGLSISNLDAVRGPIRIRKRVGPNPSSPIRETP